MAYKVFSNGDALTGGELNTYLMNQAVISFASTTARDAALPSPSEGQLIWLEDSNKYVYYTGSAWSDLITPPSGDNAIINGAFDIWQRGTSGNFTGSGYSYVGADRWWVYGYNASSTLSQQTFTPGTAPVAGYEGAYFARFNSTNTSNFFGTRLEDVRLFAGQTATLSFWAKSNSGQTLTLTELEQNFGSGGSASVYTSLTNPTLTTSWARYTITISVPSIAGKTIGTSSYIQLGFKGAINNAIDIWGVQLEAGSTATAFKRNASNIQGELAACQRYYERLTESGQFGPGFINSSTLGYGVYAFKVLKRVAPTYSSSSSTALTIYSPSTGTQTGTANASAGVTTSVAIVSVTSSGMTGGQGGMTGVAASGWVAWDAEL